MSASEEQSQGPVIKDRRRIDPVTGQPRAAEAGQAPRAAGQSRPGKHAVSKPGSPRAEGAAGAAGSGQGAPDAAEAAGPGSDQAESGAGQDQPSGGKAGSGGSARAADAEVAVKLAERTADLQRVQAEYANYRKRVERDRVAVREHALASVLSELLPVLDNIGRAREHGELNGGFKAVAEALEAAVGKLGLTAFGEAGEPFDPKVHEALMHSYSPEVTEPTCVQILQPGYHVGERILRPARVAVAEPTDPSGARTATDDSGANDGEPAAEHGSAHADAATGANGASGADAENRAGAAGESGTGTDAAGANGAAGTERGSDDTD